MAAPTNAAYVKKALANSEPSTHGTPRRFAAVPKFGPKSLANGRQACQRRARAWSPDSFYLPVHAVFVSN
jgi:hypothetical protein